MRKLSKEVKFHGLQMELHNLAARNFIFRANNTGLPGDTIDLHGLFVGDSGRDATGDARLHVIVGRGVTTWVA